MLSCLSLHSQLVAPDSCSSLTLILDYLIAGVCWGPSDVAGSFGQLTAILI